MWIFFFPDSFNKIKVFKWNTKWVLIESVLEFSAYQLGREGMKNSELHKNQICMKFIGDLQYNFQIIKYLWLKKTCLNAFRNVSN